MGGRLQDDPQDPGGATNMGITQADLKRWRQHDVTKEDVRSLTHDEAMQIFKAFYWVRSAAMRCQLRLL